MSTEELKKKIIAMIMLMVIIVIASITAIVIIWQPKETEKKNETIEIGKYNYVQSTKDYNKKYITQVLELIKAGDVDQLYNLLLPEYKESRKITKEKLEEMLKAKKLLNKEFTTYEYVNKSSGKRRYAAVTVKNISELVEEKIMIIEKAPNDYSITFDNYIYESGDFKMEFLERKLYIKVSNIKYGVETYSASIELKNTSDKNLILNKVPNKELISVESLSAGKILSSASFASGETIVLKPNETKIFPVLFTIPAFTHDTIYSLIVNSVYDEDTKKDEDIKVKIAYAR